MGYTQTKGNAAEQLACCYLQKQGLTLITRNYRCRYGEIDLIMHDNATLVFIEVRYRKANNQVDAATSIDHFKQAKIIRSAQYYLHQHQATNQLARIDVLLITEQSCQPIIDWIPNAIEA